jgi:uncharacterized protein involved in exopolysaccharide biosynthesis
VSSRQRGQQARIATQFLRSELERTQADLREQDRKIAEFKESYRGELPDELGSNLARIERLSQERDALGSQLGDAETRLAMLTTTADPVSASSPAGRLAALQAKLAEELAVNTPEHPNVMSLQRQVETLEAELARGEAGAQPGDATRPILIRDAQRSIGETRRRLAQIDAEIRETEGRVNRTAAREEALKALEERGGVLRDKYLEFLRKVEEAELAENLEAAQQGERISVLDKALPPNQPEKARIKYLAAGVVVSLVLAFAVGCLLEVSDPVMVTAAQIEAGFRLPVLGSVPRIS